MERVSEKEKKMLEFVESTNAGKKMLERKAKALSTKLEYAHASLLLSEFLNKSIDDIVNEYIVDVKANMYEASDKWEELFTEFATWLKEKKGYGNSSSAVYHAGAKSLINPNVRGE